MRTKTIKWHAVLMMPDVSRAMTTRNDDPAWLAYHTPGMKLLANARRGRANRRRELANCREDGGEPSARSFQPRRRVLENALAGGVTPAVGAAIAAMLGKP